MPGTDPHDVQLPGLPFDLMAELDRFRGMRDEVIPAEVTSLMDRATSELIRSGAGAQVAAAGTVAPGL